MDSAPDTPDELTVDEYTVLSSIFAGYSAEGGVLLVIEEDTAASSNDRPLKEALDQPRFTWTSYEPGGVRQPQPETFENLKRVNAQSRRFQRLFKLPVAYALISKSERESIFGNRNPAGFRQFYQMYPKASGITTLSRVGFNTGRTEALAYRSQLRGPLDAFGGFVLLVKAGNTWIKAAWYYYWIS